MRTLLLILLVSTGMSLTAISPAMAGGGGDGAGATNGKTPSRARFVIDNNDDEDYFIWIRPVNTPLPPTVEALRESLIAITPNRQNRRTGRLRNGNFAISLFFQSDVNGEIDVDPAADAPLDQDLFDLGEISSATGVLEGEDVDIIITDGEIVAP